MADNAEDELLGSLKRLYDNSEYSDFTILNHDKSYRVHKAIVCPRSAYFATECQKIDTEGVAGGILNLFEDPQALQMVITFLYHLDYDATTADTVLPALPQELLTNGYHADTQAEEEPKTDGHAAVASPTNGTDAEAGDGAEAEQDAPAAPAMEPATSESLDDFLPTAVPKSAKAKKKAARKRRKSVAPSEQRPPVDSTDTPASPGPAQTNGDSHPVAAVSATKDDGATQLPEEAVAPGTALSPEPEDRPALAERPPSPPPSQGQGGLTVHAKVYELSKKYGIATLQSLSLSKFAAEAVDEWDSDDFLWAAREVYSTALASPADRSMRDVVCGVVFAHPDLLERMGDVFKGLDLWQDVVMHMHRHGGLRSPGEGSAAVNKGGRGRGERSVARERESVTGGGDWPLPG